jgi:hypothetical protein
MKGETSMLNPRLNTLIMMIAAAAATRLIPHRPNLTSVTALALFGGAYFRNALLGDLGYTAVLFGGFHVLERRFSGLREPRVAIRSFSS